MQTKNGKELKNHTAKGYAHLDSEFGNKRARRQNHPCLSCDKKSMEKKRADAVYWFSPIEIGVFNRAAM